MILTDMKTGRYYYIVHRMNLPSIHFHNRINIKIKYYINIFSYFDGKPYLTETTNARFFFFDGNERRPTKKKTVVMQTSAGVSNESYKRVDNLTRQGS